MSTTRDTRAARRFFTRAIADSFHNVEQFANNILEVDHGRLKSRLRPMRGLKTQVSAQLFSSGHAFVENLRRGHYELAVAVPPKGRLIQAFAELATCSDRSGLQQPHDSPPAPTQQRRPT